MKIATRPEEIRETTPCSLALGTFDGLHRGHRAVIRAAMEGGGETGVFTFRGTPSGAPAVMTLRDKEALLEKMGVDRLYSLEFPDVRDMSPEEFFFEILLGRCRAERLCCGEDFRFGKGAAGDTALLEKLCAGTGTALAVTPPVREDGKKISSTGIRAALEAGDLPSANRLLGRPFGFAGEVIHGNHLGTGLGTPTLNQALPEELALPPFGVYASWAGLEDGSCAWGVTNIGVKPTVGSDRVLAETWLPEFSGDLYGSRVRLHLLRFLRPEKKFGSLEELKEEIRRDAGQAEKIALACPPPGFGCAEIF